MSDLDNWLINQYSELSRYKSEEETCMNHKCDNCGADNASLVWEGYRDDVIKDKRGSVQAWDEAWLCDDCAPGGPDAPKLGYGNSPEEQEQE